MNLTPGRTVVHPHHGPAEVARHFTRTVAGDEVEYVELTVAESRMNIAFPADRIDEIGIRALAGAADLEQLAEVLSAPSGQQEKQWSRRIKAETEEVNSGDPLRIAAVMRDLLRRDRADGLGTAEKQLLRDAEEPLSAEVALSVGTDTDDVLRVFRTIALEQSTAVLAGLTQKRAATDPEDGPDGSGQVA